jgi:hypothetical protein
LGTAAHDIEETDGAPRYRVDYMRDGQPASREVYEIGKTGSLVGFSFVDGVVIELEDFGGCRTMHPSRDFNFSSQHPRRLEMAMLNWNDYRNQILARVGEIGKLSPHLV